MARNGPANLDASWTCVFAANLMIPLPLGLAVLSIVGGGIVGMCVGVVTCWAVGLVACSQSDRLGKVLTDGGMVVAVCQGIPVLQFGAGVLALWTWAEVVGEGVAWTGASLREVGGFVVTLLTAQPLLLAALAFGGGHRLLLEEGDPELDEPPEDA